MNHAIVHGGQHYGDRKPGSALEKPMAIQGMLNTVKTSDGEETNTDWTWIHGDRIGERLPRPDAVP